MRYETFASNEYYHLYARGSNQENIFIDEHDKVRFIFLLCLYTSPTRINNTFWYVNNFIKKGVFGFKPDKLSDVTKDKSLELNCFCVMDNHFHILVRNVEDNMISVYMHRVLTAYSKYFNAKYRRKGHVFDGPYKAVHIKNNNQILHLSAYIHKNPKDIKEWSNKYEKYPWSSLSDYISTNKWGNFISKDIILGQFKTQTDYKNFVSTSTAKEYLFEDLLK